MPSPPADGEYDILGKSYRGHSFIRVLMSILKESPNSIIVEENTLRGVLNSQRYSGPLLDIRGPTMEFFEFKIDIYGQLTSVTDYPLQTILAMEPIGCRAPQKEPLLDTRLMHAEKTIWLSDGVFSYLAVTSSVSRKCLSVALNLCLTASSLRLTRRACWHVVSKKHRKSNKRPDATARARSKAS